MEEIKYNSETKEIQFSGKITSFKFYTQLFSALNDHYRVNGSQAIPAFSFVYVDEFEATVLPNLISVGQIIKKKHGGTKRIPLTILNTFSTKFLESTKFFDNVGTTKKIGEEFIINNIRTEVIKDIGLEIFQFNTKQLGFYNYSDSNKWYNPIHKIQVFDNSSFEYYKNYNDEFIPRCDLEYVLDTIRTKKYYEILPKVEKYFYEILHQYQRPTDEIKTILAILTEIICNSILYSDSLCAAMLQSVDGKTTMSISDQGIGFAGSLKYKPNFEYYVSKTFRNPYKDKLKNYLLIFDALHYSKSKDRENLYSLLKLIIDQGGKMRIHYDNVQTVFTSNRCKKCNLIPIKCASCLLENLSNDKMISPVRFFDTTFRGIHIEIELNS
jgi:hypothetical protein